MLSLRMTRKLTSGVAAPEAKWSLVGGLQGGTRGFGADREWSPSGKLRLEKKQGWSYHRAHLGQENTDTRLSSHWLPHCPLPSRVPRNQAARDITMETRRAWIQWTSLRG